MGSDLMVPESWVPVPAHPWNLQGRAISYDAAKWCWYLLEECTSETWPNQDTLGSVQPITGECVTHSLHKVIRSKRCTRQVDVVEKNDLQFSELSLRVGKGDDKWQRRDRHEYNLTRATAAACAENAGTVIAKSRLANLEVKYILLRWDWRL